MNALVASLPDELVATIASFIKLKPTIEERYSKLLRKLTSLNYNNEWNMMLKIEKNPHFYGYRSFKICKKIIKYQVSGEKTPKYYHSPIWCWNKVYAENRLRENIIYTLERLEGCANDRYRRYSNKCGKMGIW